VKRPTFLRGVLVALVLALAGAAIFAALSPVFGSNAALRGIITLLGGAYVLYLLSSSRERTGRIVVPALWLAAAAVFWSFLPALLPFTVAHVGLIWLVRSLYHHSGVLRALGDLALSALSLAAALWALGSGSVFLTLWCFFLVQGLFVALIATDGKAPALAADDSFRQARLAAEAALKSLLTH
jgi:hypothetical protein